MKDKELRKEHELSMQNGAQWIALIEKKLREVNQKIQTLEDTILNLTPRLRKLELEAHPECEKCGRVL